MGLERNLKRVVSDGGDCFVCELPTVAGSQALQVSFNVPLVIVNHRVSRLIHIPCAKELLRVLDKRIKESV